MKSRINGELIDLIKEYLAIQAEARANNVKSRTGPDELVLDLFREAFRKGGLSSVDALIESINETLRYGGTTEGLGEGAALQHSDGEHPPFLHIFFVDFRTEKVLARECIPLIEGAPGHASSQAAPPA